MSLAGCQINPIDVNFYLQKSLEIFDKNSAEKIWFKKDKEINVSPLMPIRVKRCRAPTCRVSTMHILWAQGIKNDFYLALPNASKTPLKSKVTT